MHYQNGREAKNGDKVVVFPSYGAPVIGILYDAVAGNDFCNGRIAPTSPSDPMPNLKECLHFDDVHAACFPVPAVSPATQVQPQPEPEVPGVPSTTLPASPEQS